MENQQERHTRKIELLSKCIEADVLTLQDALFLLDADQPVTPIAPSDSTTWQPSTYYPTIHPNLVPYSQPLTGSGTIMGASSASITGLGTTTLTTYPPGTNITYTNTAGSATDTTAKL